MLSLNIFSSLTATRKAPSSRSTTIIDGYQRNALLDKASVKKPAISIIISKWSTGWTTIFSMYLLYLLAFGLAISHLLLFYYLDGKPAGKNNAALCSGLLSCATEIARSQTNISTASILLSNAFGIAIRISLAIAFTQYLWKIFRTSSLTVDTIESLFNIRSNIFELSHISIFKPGWVLVLIALILYLIPIAISFPPGALTVETINYNFTVQDTILTFNSTYLGNGSFADTAEFFIPPTSMESTGNDTIYSNTFKGPNPVLQRLAANIALAGQSLAMPSPCGSNCSYSFQFVGPSVKCNGESTNTTLASEVDIYPMFSGSWSYFQQGFVPIFKGPNSNAILNITVLDSAQFVSESNFSAITGPKMTLICVPFRALYTVNNSYLNNNQTLAYTYSQLAQLTNVDAGLNLDSLLEHMGKGFNVTFNLSAQDNTNWVGENLDWYRDSQLMGIITAMATVLSGSYSACFAPSGGVSFWDCGTDIGNSGFVAPGLGSYLIPYTNFNIAPQTYGVPGGSSNSLPVILDITESSLNQLLGNLTLSTLSTLGLWNEKVNITKSLQQNVFSFSHPINLILPYFLSILLALPFLIVGTFALIQNGVPATDGGFIQILSTTTGSRALQQVAAGNCLAGEEHRSKQLQSLKIRYGELVDLQVRVGGAVVRRAGFGTDDEVEPLRKGEKYGVVGE